MVMAIVGKRIKQLRIDRNLKQQDLADRIEVSQAVVSNWERGLSEPPYMMLLRIAEALGVNPAVLLGTEEQTKIPPALAAGSVTVRFVPVVKNVFLKDPAAEPENVQSLAPFPNEGGGERVIGFRLTADTGTYLANDILFLEIKEEYRKGEQVLIAELSTGEIKISEYSEALERQVIVGAVVGFYRLTR